MSHSTEIAGKLKGLDAYQCSCVAAACAESVSPVIDHFAEPETSRTFGQGLNILWHSLHSKKIDEKLAAIRLSIESLSEAACDNSNLPAYDVMVILGVLSYAIDAAQEKDSCHAATSACDMAANYSSGCDMVIERGTRSIITDPAVPRQPGHLESLQLQLQLRLIACMQEQSSGSNQIDEMQRLANQFALKLKDVIAVYQEKRGWA